MHFDQMLEKFVNKTQIECVEIIQVTITNDHKSALKYDSQKFNQTQSHLLITITKRVSKSVDTSKM